VTEHIARSEKQLGAILRRARKASGMTQAQLGEKISLRQATVSKLEDGAPATRLQTAMAALAALDLELVIRPRSKSSASDLEEIF
jgi:HTH-type transcriptional regulator / antitoxin HipB